MPVIVKSPVDLGAHTFVETNGIRLHVVQAGPASGPLVILLHGFPEFWLSWRRQMRALAAAGFRVWVPDQRGYNLSDKPVGVAAYGLDELAADVVGLMDAAGVAQARVVGHDWGGAVAWWTANKYPERVAQLGVLNVPHNAVMQRRIRESRAQQRKSWYMAFFQLPLVPELTVRAGSWRAAVRALQLSSRPGTFSEADLDALRTAWSQPRAFTAMLNWYRAVVRARPSPLPSPRISVPTLLIWGREDVFFEPDLARLSMELCDNGRFVYIENATHWVHHEAAPQVNRLLIDFLSERGP